MRNSTFLVITILLVGGLFCLGVKKWGNTTPFPDQRGLQLAPTSNIQYRGSQPRRDEAATRLATTQATSYHPQAATRLTTTRGTSYSPHRDEEATRLAISGAGTGSYTLHSSAASSLHSVGGGSSISASGLQGQKHAGGNGASGSGYAGVASLSMPTLAFNTLSAADATNPATTRSTIRSIQPIGYTTYSNESGDSRRKVYRPGVSEEDEGWYWDEEEGEWYEIPTGESNIDGLGVGTFTGQQVLHNGDLYEWNGTEWIKISEDPSEVNYPIGDGAWLLLLLAVAYAVRKEFLESPPAP